ncbi:TPA: O-acetyl-ADP-ribose deacetylase [Candidatus Woesearchaeota archaeon]|nr:O-acetyl-ADP-ribose deacetylase [Candidatus Woesearchaeota archaeon]HII69359.1 O-acetyl-ADP-ribose deacetylase [Candidatus Woesearchaeota archaeon]
MAKPLIRLLRYDITALQGDAIVNAANSTLLGGGGVDGAIHSKAGQELLEACRKLRETKLPDGLPVGQVVITPAFKLGFKYVIHTVGPRYGDDDINLLKDCYLNALVVAGENGCRDVFFPAISTGAYGLPIAESARIVKRVLDGFSSEGIKTIVLVLHSEKDLKAYEREFGRR